MTNSSLIRGVRFILTAGCLLALGACQSINTSSIGPRIGTTPETASAANIESLTAVIQSNPRDPGAYNVRGTAYAQAGRYKEALQDFDTALQLDPGYSAAYSNRALIYRRQGKTPNRGLVRQQLGQHQQAIVDFTRAIGISPQAVAPYNGRGLSYLATGDAKTALEDFNEAISRDRSDPQGWINQGLALEQLGEKRKAFDSFARAANLDPRSSDARAGMKRNA
jgi:tetratricopeptide (TPR) repeat protein